MVSQWYEWASVVAQMVRICLQCRRSRFDPWKREWLPNPVFLPGKFHGLRSLAGYSPMGSQRAEHDWEIFTFCFFVAWISCYVRMEPGVPAAWARPGAFIFEPSLEGRGWASGGRSGWHSDHFLPRKVQNGQRRRGETEQIFQLGCEWGSRRRCIWKRRQASDPVDSETVLRNFM